MTASISTADIGQTIAAIAARMSAPDLSAVSAAELRRWQPGEPPPMAFHVVWASVSEEDPQPLQEWAAIVTGMALLRPDPHRAGRCFGRAIAAAGCSDARFARFVDAEARTSLERESRLRELLRLTRIAAIGGERFDWTDPAAMLVAGDEADRRAARTRICVGFVKASSGR